MCFTHTQKCHEMMRANFKRTQKSERIFSFVTNFFLILKHFSSFTSSGTGSQLLSSSLILFQSEERFMIMIPNVGLLKITSFFFIFLVFARELINKELMKEFRLYDQVGQTYMTYEGKYNFH